MRPLLQPGSVFAGYRIESKLGRGGMGMVFKATELELERPVALKVLIDELDEDSSARERFLREARAAAQLSHPNVVQIYRVGIEGEMTFLAMEIVDGGSLHQLIKVRGKIDPKDAATLLLQAATGLAVAHRIGIVHRDIKPANLLLTSDGLVKIADFGLALRPEEVSRLTATGMFVGTPGYLAPEQCMGKDADHRTDIYALGVTFYEMLTGQLPFMADSPMALIRKIVEVDPPLTAELESVDPRLRKILDQMVAKEPAKRYQSIETLVVELRAFLGLPDSMSASTLPAVAIAVATTPAPIATEMLDSGGTEMMAQKTVQTNRAEASPPPIATAPVTAPPPPPVPVAPAPAAPPTPVAPASPQPVVNPQPEVVAAAPPPATAKSSLALPIAVGLLAVAVLTVGLIMMRNGGNEEASAQGLVQAPVEVASNLPEASSDPITTAAGAVTAEPTQEPSTSGTQPAESGGGSLPAEAGGAPATSTEIPTAIPVQVASAQAIEPDRSTGQRPSNQRPVADAIRERVEERRAAVISDPFTIVIGLGEPVLAESAERAVAERLRRYGGRVLEAGEHRGAAELLRHGRDGFTISDLRSRVRANDQLKVVVIEATPAGGRNVSSIAGYDVVYSASVRLRAYAGAELALVKSSKSVRVEYVALNVDDKIRDATRPLTRELLSALGLE